MSRSIRARRPFCTRWVVLGLVLMASAPTSLTSCVEKPDTLGLGEAYPFTVPQLEASGTSATSIRLNWSGVSGAGAYRLQMTDDPNSWYSSFPNSQSKWLEASEADSNGQFTASFSSLEPERIYYFRIRTEERSQPYSEGTHSQWSRTLQARATDQLPPPPVEEAQATDNDGRSWTIRWQTPPGVEGFEVRYTRSTATPSWSNMIPLPTFVPASVSPFSGWTLRDEDLLGGLVLEEVYALGVRGFDAAGNLSDPVYFRPEVRITPENFRDEEVLTGDFPCSVSPDDQLAGGSRARLRLAQECFFTSLVDLSTNPVQAQCEVGVDVDLTRIYTISDGWTYARVSEADAESLTVELLRESFFQTEPDCQVRTLRMAHAGATHLVPSRGVLAFTTVPMEPGAEYRSQPFSIFLHNVQTGLTSQEIAIDPASLRTEYFSDYDAVVVRDFFVDTWGVGLLLSIPRSGESTQSAFAHVTYDGEVSQAWRFGFGVGETAWYESGRPVVYASKRISSLWVAQGVWIPLGDATPPSGIRDMRFFDLGRTSVAGFFEIISMTWYQPTTQGWLLLEESTGDLQLLEFAY